MTETRRAIEEEIAVVLKEGGRAVPTISDGSALMQGGLGLDSMDFAVLVVRLEQRLGCDPFNSAALEQFPTTVAELASLYEQTRAKLAA
jgi:acyl carrier protein